MTRSRRLLVTAMAGLLAVSTGSVLSARTSSADGFGYDKLNAVQKRHVSGLLAGQLNGDDRARSQRQTASPGPRATIRPPQAGPAGCRLRRGDDVKVNVNCLNVTDSDLQGRSQAQNETSAAVDPSDARRVVAVYNDYRRGDGTCGVSYSGDAGRTWADSTLPNGFTRGGPFGGKERQYWQSSGDPSVAFDSRGDVFLTCQTFNRGAGTSPNPDQSSAIHVFRSTGSHGASWNFPGRPVVAHDDTAGAGNFLLDKPLMAVDHYKASRFRDRVYVTWTTFAADGTGYVYESHSADYGESFSAPVLVSRDSALCGNTFGLPTPSGRCNANQNSQPFVAPDGTLYVVYDNYNNVVTGNDNRNQFFVVRSSDGGATFSPPVKAGDFYELPDCQTYQGQDAGRACVPEKGSSRDSYFRASNYPAAAVDPRDPHRVVVTHGSYVSRSSNEHNGCTPTGFAANGLNLYSGVKTGGCNNDILLSVSTDAGHSFTGTTTDPRLLPVVTDGGRQTGTDQFFQGADFSPSGRLVVSYYDRQYGDDERTGYSDVTVSASRELRRFAHTRATSSSMPAPTQFSGLFWGDYAGLAVSGTRAYPVWSDTRAADLFTCPGSPPTICTGAAPNAPVANDQDIYTSPLGIPGS